MVGNGQVRRRVEAHLVQLGVDFDAGPEDSLRVDAGSAAVFISIRSAGDFSVVEMTAPVLVDVPPDPERMLQLLEINADLTFGKFSWDPAERIVSVEYELVGDAVDAIELHAALEAVKKIADTCDDRLQPEIGGRLPLS